MFLLHTANTVSGTLWESEELDGHLIESNDTKLLLMQAWHNAKIALITVTLYAPTAMAMLGAGWSSRHFQERRWHCSAPLVIAAIAFMCAARPTQLHCLHERSLACLTSCSLPRVGH